MLSHAKTSDPEWYRDAIIYELHVRAFFDSDADGIGDFPGLTQKLDYLRDLGVTTLWLLPFYPSPLKDDGYDIADYTGVHPVYGTLRDFKTFLDAAHERGLRVVTELVLNHTSDEHPWFQRARNAPPGSRWRDFYVWSERPDRYREARVIFQDYERSNWSWDPDAGAYYWHRFYSHQPDLNYGNPAVRRAIFQVVDFWLKMGVDGLRLDAVPYLAEQEGTSSENLPGTHAFLKSLRRYIDDRYQDRLLLAEANQWPEDAAAYFGEGDECHMAFHFPLMPRLFIAVKTEDRLPILDIMDQTPAIPDGCQWALFLRNHDELTLEMVTDEERLYMYRAFAEAPETRLNLGIRRRLAPLLGNSRRRIELMNGLLFSLPGTPVLYYGDEIGMGDNVYLGDRNGVRTPMQWSADRNAGFSRAHPQQLYLPLVFDHEYHHESVHVEAQTQNPHSVLAFTRRLIALRRRSRAFGRGSLEFLHPANRHILAFIRRLDDECILVVANLSRFAQAVELDLAEFRGLVPVELFGRSPFWPIADTPYHMTLGPHTFHWFSLEPAPLSSSDAAQEEMAGEQASTNLLPTIQADQAWQEVVTGRHRGALERVLPVFLARQPWFGGRHYRLLWSGIEDVIPIPVKKGQAFLSLVRIHYADADAETYLLPFTATRFDESATRSDVGAAIARVRTDDGEETTLIDASEDARFSDAVRQICLGRRKPLVGSGGHLICQRTQAGRGQLSAGDGQQAPLVCETAQHNTSIFFGDRLVLKLLRRIDEGPNPEAELGAWLTERQFPHVPPLLAWLDYRGPRSQATTLAVLHRYVKHEADCWTLAVDGLAEFLKTVENGDESPPAGDSSIAGLLDHAGKTPPAALARGSGSWFPVADLLGRRLAQLHLALADSTDPALKPTPFTSFAHRSQYQTMRGSAVRLLRELRVGEHQLADGSRELVAEVLDSEQQLLDRFRRFLQRPSDVDRIRCHGNFHLGQVLRTDDDIVIIDLEGDPERSLSERRLKAAALRDVAEMIRSLDDAAETVSLRQAANPAVPGAAQDWARSWYHWSAAVFLGGYLAEAGDQAFVPQELTDRVTMLDALLLERAVLEAGFELTHRPDRLPIPLRGLLRLLASSPTDPATDTGPMSGPGPSA